MGDVTQILSAEILQSRSVTEPGPAGTTKNVTKTGKLAPPAIPSSHAVPKHLKQTGILSRPMAVLADTSRPGGLASASLPPIVPAAPFSSNAGEVIRKPGGNIKINKKYIAMSSARKARPWTWAPFSSSARTDGLLLNHWVRAGVEYPDYPYARFNIHLQPLSYTEDEKGLRSKDSNSNAYESLGLNDEFWTRSETDTLLELCRVHELRWPVIIDRWICMYGGNTNKKIEDLQHRYYTIGMILNRNAVEQAAKSEADSLTKAIAANNLSGSVTSSDPMTSGLVQPVQNNDLVAERALANAVVASAAYNHTNVTATLQPPIPRLSTGTSNQIVFDLQMERKRRQILEDQWNRSKEEELEELQLQKELEQIDAQIRKLKKSGGHLLASTTSLTSFPTSSRPTPLSSRVPSPSTVPMDEANLRISSGPTPTAGTPYLQSGRLGHPALDCGISKVTLKRMDQVLKELGIRERPLPTKTVCDLYDTVRQQCLALLTLQKIVLKDEADVVIKRLKLDKLTGTTTTTAPGTAAKSSPSSHNKPASSSAATKPADVPPATQSVKKTSSSKKKASSSDIPPSSVTSIQGDINLSNSTNSTTGPVDKPKKLSGTKRKSNPKNTQPIPTVQTWNGMDPSNCTFPNDFLSGSISSPLHAPTKQKAAAPIFNGAGAVIHAAPTPIKFGNGNSYASAIASNEETTKPKKRPKKSSVPTVDNPINHLKEA